MRRALVIAVVIIMALFTVTVARAVHETTDIHWHDEGTTYQIRSSIPSSWEDDIEFASDEWHDNTNITLTGNGVAVNWIEKDEIPDENPCDPDTSAACALIRLDEDDGDHLLVVDIIFNEDLSWGTNVVPCTIFNSPDVKEVAVHEFGHLAGWLGESTLGGDAVMSSPENYGCFREVKVHDISSMNWQYNGH